MAVVRQKIPISTCAVLQGHLWASGTTGTGSSVGSGYRAYGRTVTGGVRISM